MKSVGGKFWLAKKISRGIKSFSHGKKVPFMCDLEPFLRFPSTDLLLVRRIIHYWYVRQGRQVVKDSDVRDIFSPVRMSQYSLMDCDGS